MDIGTVWTVLQSVVSQPAAEAATAITGADIRAAAAAIGAAIAIGLGVFAGGLSEGLAAAKACEGVARNPEAAGPITRTMLIGQAVAESNSIYALVIALLILILIK